LNPSSAQAYCFSLPDWRRVKYALFLLAEARLYGNNNKYSGSHLPDYLLISGILLLIQSSGEKNECID
jgi:hypothetical protein